MRRPPATQRFSSLNRKTAIRLFLCAVILSVPGAPTAIAESAPNQPSALARIEATIKSLKAEQVNAVEECSSGDQDACGRSEDLQQQVRDRRNQIKRVEKTEALKAKFAASGKPSYLEQSRHFHVWPDQTFKTPGSSTGFRLDPATLTYLGKFNGRNTERRIHTGGGTSSKGVIPDEGQEHLKRIFPLRSGKNWTYGLTGVGKFSSGAGEKVQQIQWGISGEVMEEMIRTDPAIGPIYCFRINHRLGAITSLGMDITDKGQSTLCPVYGLAEKYLKGVAEGLGIDGPFNFSRTKLRPVFVDISGPKVSLKKTVLARFIQGIQDPEAVERQRLLAEAKQKAEKEKRLLAQETRLLGEREAKRRAEERRLYEELAGSARQYLATVQKYLADNPDTPSVMAIVTQTAGVHTALKKGNGTGIRTGLKALRQTLSREKSFAKYVAAIEADRQKKVAAAARVRREKLAVEILKKRGDLKSYAGFLKRQIIRNISNPGLTSALIPHVKELQAGLESEDLGVLTSLRNRAAATLKKHGLTGQYALVEKMLAGARAAAGKKDADDRRRMAAEKKARVAAVRQENAPTRKTNPFVGMHFGSYHALVIGNNRYRHLQHLKSARNDATSVTRLLSDQYGFRVSKLNDATRSDILGALARYRATLKPDDNLLIYYAGHGVVDNVTEQGFWLPIDAEEQNPTNWISNSDLTGMLRAIRARHVMVVADSCYSGTLVRAASAKLRTAREKVKWVKRMLTKRGRTALVSGGLEPVSDSGIDGKHSVFAEAFLSALRENNNVMDGRALFDAIKRPVVLNADQTPQYSDIKRAGHEGGEFMFVRKTVQ